MKLASVMKSAAKRLGLIALSLLVALALGEIALRVYYGGMFGQRPGFFTADDTLGWKATANLDHNFFGNDFSIHVRTDENGYRLGSLGEVDFDKELIILCGDSYVFGWGVSTNETFASYLDELVSDRTNKQMRVVNLGVGGYGTLQSLDRLDGLLSSHDNIRAAAIILVHCQNDALDNVKSLGFKTGATKSKPKRPASRSRFHLLNFFRYTTPRLRGILKRPQDTAEETTTEDLSMQDVLWAFEKTRPKSGRLPDTFIIEGDTVSLVSTPARAKRDKTGKKKRITRTQRALLRAGTKGFNTRALQLGCPVFHTYVCTTTDAYVDEVDALIKDSANENTVLLGRINWEKEFFEELINDHSGKHYTPEYNRFWAQRVFGQLGDAGVFDKKDR